MSTIENPCKDRQCMPPAYARWYNFFRAIGFALLLALLLALWGRGRQFATIAAPTIGGLSGTVDPGTYTLNGTGTPGSIIEVNMNGQRLGRLPIGADGTWSIEASNLNVGNYTAIATAYDADQGVHGSADIEWKVVAPVASAISPDGEPEPEAEPVVCVEPTLMLPSGSVSPNGILLSGLGTPGTKVEIFRNDDKIGTADVADSGNWTLLTRATQYHSDFEAFGCLDEGRLSSGVSRLTLAGAATPVMFEDGSACDGFFLNDDGSSTGTLSLSGVGEAGMTVEISVDGAVIGSSDVDNDGTWSFASELSVAKPDSQVINVRLMAADGTELSMADGALCDIQDLAMADSSDGEAEPEEEPETETSAGSGVNKDLVVGEIGTRGDVPTIGTVGFGMSGTGRPGAIVIVLEDGTQVGGATVQDDGTWSCSCMLAPGEHTLSIQDADDPSIASEAVTFVVENKTKAPVPPTEISEPFVCYGNPPHGDLVGTVYFVAQCESFGLIADRLGTTVARLLEYNPQVADVRLIYPGQGLNVPLDAGCFDDNHDG